MQANMVKKLLWIHSMHKVTITRKAKAEVVRAYLRLAYGAVYNLGKHTVARGHAHDLMFSVMTYGPHLCIIRRTGMVVLDRQPTQTVVYPHGLEVKVKMADGIYVDKHGARFV